MHLLQDENGNPVCHGHDGGHCHSHEEGHQYGHGPMETKEQMAALLSYMLKHNQSHAAELDRMAGKLLEQGHVVASEQVRKAVDEYAKGNLYLSLALSSVKDL